MDTTERRQRQIEDLLARFRETRPEMKVAVRIYPCLDSGIENCRGVCNPADFKAQEQSAPIDESALPLPLQTSNGIMELTALRVGDYLHVSVSSARPGFLHLFNLGTSGSVAKLFPHSANAAQDIPANVRLFVTGGGASPFRQSPYRELGDGEGTSLGQTNGYPERLLAVVSQKSIRLRASDLFPDWTVYDMNFRSADGWQQVDGAGEWFWSLSEGEWEWGVIEVPVENPTNQRNR